MECVWYCYGALLQQGGTKLPDADSGRLVVGSWWLFVIITVSLTCNNDDDDDDNNDNNRSPRTLAVLSPSSPSLRSDFGAFVLQHL